MDNLEEKLHDIHIHQLRDEEKQTLFARIVVAKTHAPVGGKRTLFTSFFNTHMGIIAGILALVVGLTGTAFASNEAKPGDALYGVDKALEEVRYTFAGEQGKEKLKVRFAEERVEEFQEVLAEDATELDESTGSSAPQTPVDLSASTTLEVEIDVFTDITVVKVEANDTKYYFTTTTLDAEAVLAEAAAFFSIDIEKLRTLAVVEIEDRASRPKDRGVAVSLDDEDVQQGYAEVSSAIATLEGSVIGDDMKQILASLLQAYVATEVIEEIDIRLSDGTRLDIEDGEWRIKSDDLDVRFKDGEFEIKDKSDDDDSDDDSDDGDDDDSSDDDDSDEDINDDDKGDVKEDDDEVFCRGEWRDAEDCGTTTTTGAGTSTSDDSDDNSDSDDDDNSGSGSDDDSNDNSDDDSDDGDDDNSGSGGDDDSEDEDEDEDEDDDSDDSDDDDDNSGHGGGDDEEDDD
jgi:hypothetical protein